LVFVLHEDVGLLYKFLI